MNSDADRKSSFYYVLSLRSQRRTGTPLATAGVSGRTTQTGRLRQDVPDTTSQAVSTLSNFLLFILFLPCDSDGDKDGDAAAERASGEKNDREGRQVKRKDK